MDPDPDLDSGFWILDSGFWILDSGFWILDSGLFWRRPREGDVSWFGSGLGPRWAGLLPATAVFHTVNLLGVWSLKVIACIVASLLVTFMCNRLVSTQQNSRYQNSSKV
jgi:hypothetical protein